MISVTSPTRLRIEHDPQRLGVGAATPRLSWWLPTGSTEQRAYRIEAVVDDSDTITSGEVRRADSLLQPWPFPALGSRQRVRWRIQVETDAGWSEWSDSDEFEIGLLDLTDWQAHFIGDPEDGPPLPLRGERGAHYFQRILDVEKPIARGRVYATAHGIYELHIDGQRVGDLELTPGFTDYRSHLDVQTYDITDMLTPGRHALTATVTDGWWRGSIGFARKDCAYGTSLALLAQVELVAANGDRLVIGTDDDWQVSTSGPIAAADLMAGERFDQRMPFPPTDGWRPVSIVAPPGDRLTISPAPPARRVETYTPRGVTRLDSERQVVDLGVNINGWVRVSGRSLGEPGTVTRLRHGEVLGDDGDVDRRNITGMDMAAGQPTEPGQTDEVISAGSDAPDFEPRHTTHGFQYVGVDGADDLTADDVIGVMVHTDFARTGWFRCSDERINALHEAAVLSFRGNACEIPTDCPQRERAGWTGDWQIFVPTAAFLYDVAGFSTRWLRDLSAEQWDDGRLPNYVPDALGPNASDWVNHITGSAGWGDAAVLVPYQIWQSYGDLDLLDRQYASMQRWIDFALQRAANLRHSRRAQVRHDPAPHERYLWDHGFHWGEWCEPGTPAGAEGLAGDPDFGEIATAYLQRSLATLAETAALIGRTDDSARYRELAAAVRAAWQTEYVSDDGAVTPATQANLVRALAFELVETEHRARVAADLVELIRAADTHLGTGFLATPFLLPVLADTGHVDVAYELLFQKTPPSWLSMIDRGATTIWENWEGIAEDGTGSLNHYSKGAVVSFLHQHVAGIRPIRGVPAYKRFEVRPLPGGGITSAEARLDSPYGPITSSWKLEGDQLALEVEVPPGAEADVTLPDGSTHKAGPGSEHFQVATHSNEVR